MQLSLEDKYHLASRATFFAHHNELSKKENAKDIVDELFRKQKVQLLQPDLPKIDHEDLRKKSEKERRELRKIWKKQVLEVNAIWVRQMCQNEGSLIEKMTLFWHGHFACRTVSNPYQALELNNAMRKEALGSFKSLLLAVARSPAMIGYLHLKQNKKGKPNEDFARELCELFTLGRDVDYTEKDVTEIARAFTGWTVGKDGKHVINPRQHDTGIKTIFGNTGNFGGEEVLDMILENKNTARFIATKVYRFFVRENPEKSHVEELAEVFFNSDYNISEMMRYLFMVPWFYQSKGEIIKSPISLLVTLGKIFNLNYAHDQTLVKVQRYLGQTLFDPPNVAGWPGGRKWIDSSRMAFRLRLASLILYNGIIEDNLSPALDEAPSNKERKKKQLQLGEEIDWELFNQKNKDANLVQLLLRSGLEPVFPSDNKGEGYIVQLLSTPDFQLE